MFCAIDFDGGFLGLRLYKEHPTQHIDIEPPPSDNYKLVGKKWVKIPEQEVAEE